jgi:anti-sigma B factor antagonist
VAAPASDGAQFAVVDAAPGRVAGVVVRGEVDIATAGALTDAIDAAVRLSSGPFLLDLTDVTFFDSSGLQALLRARSRLAGSERRLALVCPPGAVRRVLEQVRLDELFALYDTPAAAAAALGAG